VYARFEWETEAQAAVDNLNDRWYAGMCYLTRSILDDRFPPKVDPCTPSCRPSLTFARLAAAKMKMANATGVVFAISCICDSLRRSSCLLFAPGNDWKEDLIRLGRKAVEVAGNPPRERVVEVGVLVHSEEVETIDGLGSKRS
jgi:hypothetical protein